jgi:hypothetical protein
VKPNRALLAIATAVTYGLVGFALYRQRVVSGAEAWGSDLLVFGLPMVLAFVSFTMVFWPGLNAAPSPGVAMARLRALGFAALATAVSFWSYACIAFSRYGT